MGRQRVRGRGQVEMKRRRMALREGIRAGGEASQDALILDRIHHHREEIAIKTLGGGPIRDLHRHGEIAGGLPPDPARRHHAETAIKK